MEFMYDLPCTSPFSLLSNVAYTTDTIAYFKLLFGKFAYVIYIGGVSCRLC